MELVNSMFAHAGVVNGTSYMVHLADVSSLSTALLSEKLLTKF